MNSLIYGKNQLDRIVSIEPGDDKCVVFRELQNGKVERSEVPMSHWILFTEQRSDKMRRLDGNQPFRWIMEYSDRAKFLEVLASCYKKRYDLYVCRDPKEAVMVKDGLTYFKGLKVSDVSVLSTDLETTGVLHDKDSKVLLISNTFRRLGKIERKLFSLDEFPDQASMLNAWCAWVIEKDPSVIVGHNLYGFDFPYLRHVADLSGARLTLGRDGSELEFASRMDNFRRRIPRVSHFRKDGSQAYDYVNVDIYGREVVDTYFLSMKYDTSARREYDSYGLKYIVEFELDALRLKKKEEPKKFTALDEEFMHRLSHGGNRTFYDASKIRDNWHVPEERTKIKAYAIDDSDDALSLYDLMIPSLFYYTMSVPRSFQQIINSATGSQINSLMVRAYLQDGHSIAMGDPKESYEGAIAFGVPGIHKNVFKIDVASLYPSIIRQYKIYNKEKDPKGLFLQLVDTFTLERLKNKKLGETDRYFKDLSDSQKIAINSMYGFLGAPELNYNYPSGAEEVTRYGREILKQAIKWASGNDYVKTLPAAKGEVDDVA